MSVNLFINEELICLNGEDNKNKDIPHFIGSLEEYQKFAQAGLIKEGSLILLIDDNDNIVI